MKCVRFIYYFQTIKFICNFKFFTKYNWRIPLCGWHSTKAFPVIPGGQVQIGTWFDTIHMELTPHVPEQGSRHFCLIHALFLGQSEFKTHSGRQLWYGSPWYSGMQVHTPLLQTVFCPHGLGLQGSSATDGAKSIFSVKNNCNMKLKLFYLEVLHDISGKDLLHIPHSMHKLEYD